MVNILFDCPNIDDFCDELKDYFSKNSRVAVIAFSFYDDYVYDTETWEQIYGKGIGNCYFETIEPLGVLGVPEENMVFINYFTDTKETARQKIENANVLYFTGGLPDRMMDRIEEFDLTEVLKAFDGVVVGYSAGAVIQLKEYHLTPDNDYPAFGYYRGLGYIDDLCIEVHYEHKEIQDASVKRVLKERRKPVYVTHTRQGGIVVEKDRVRMLGNVDLYTP